jgi:hypothetical protein
MECLTAVMPPDTSIFDARSKISAGGFVFGVAFGAALQLGDIHSPQLMLLAGAIAGASLVYMMWHGINVLLSRRGKPSLKLEPVHVILIGLLITAAGLGWQWAKGNVALSSNWAAPAPASPASPAQTAAAKRLSPADINKRIEAIDLAYNIALQARRFADAAPGIVETQFWPMLKDGSAPNFLQKYAGDFKPILDQIQDFARTYRSYLPDVDRAFLGTENASWVIGLHRNCLELRQEIINWQGREFWLQHIESSAVLADWKRSMRSLRDWNNQAIFELEKLRREYAASQ